MCWNRLLHQALIIFFHLKQEFIVSVGDSSHNNENALVVLELAVFFLFLSISVV